MPDNILVTGAAGYIGSLTVAALVADGRAGKVVAYDKRPPVAQQGAETVIGDITADDLVALLTEHAIDTVIHLASILKPPRDAAADLAWRVDVLGTRRLLEACIAAGVQQLVVTTSGAAYGYHPDNPMWMTESARIRGHEAFDYSRNKRQVEELLAQYRDAHPQLGQLLLRPGTVIGKGTDSPVTEIFQGPVILGVSGSSSPFVFIWDRDLIEVIVQGALLKRRGIYNMAGDGALTSAEIARRLGKPYLTIPAPLLKFALALAKKLRLSVHGPETLDFLRYRPVLDNTRLKAGFGYQPVSSAAAFQAWLDDSDHPQDPTAEGDLSYRQVVVITGGAGGIGQALAQRWSIEGARIALLDRDGEALAAAAKALADTGADVFTVQADVTDAGSIRQAMDAIVDHYGHIDVLVNNAGAVHRSAFRDTRLSVYRRVMEVNFFGSLNCTKAALPQLLKTRGLIVVTSSIAGVAPLYGRSGYAASKHALHGLFESLRCELVEDGLRVLMVCPGFTRSGFEQAAMGADGNPARTRRSMTGRLAEPAEVADAVVHGALRGKNLVVLTPLGRLSYYLSRLAPGLYARGMIRRLGGKDQVH